MSMWATDYEADMAQMAADPVTQAWWKLTDPCQQPVESAAEGEKWAEMEEVIPSWTERRRYVDTHVHFWDSSVIDYPWLAGASAIAHPHLPGRSGTGARRCLA